MRHMSFLSPVNNTHFIVCCPEWLINNFTAINGEAEESEVSAFQNKGGLCSLHCFDHTTLLLYCFSLHTASGTVVEEEWHI